MGIILSHDEKKRNLQGVIFYYLITPILRTLEAHLFEGILLSMSIVKTEAAIVGGFGKRTNSHGILKTLVRFRRRVRKMFQAGIRSIIRLGTILDVLGSIGGTLSRKRGVRKKNNRTYKY